MQKETTPENSDFLGLNSLPDCLFLFVLGHRILTGLFVLKEKESGGMLASRLEKTLRFFQCSGGFSDVFQDLKDASFYAEQAERALKRGPL